MIEADITVAGETVKIMITFRNGYAGYATWTFSNVCSDRSYAGLAAAALRTQFNTHMRNIREELYEQGYSDGMAKRKRQTRFDSCL